MTHYRRAPLLDLLVADGEALVLLAPDQVVRLSPIATALVEATATPASVDHLITVTEQQFGAAPNCGTPSAVAAILAELVAAGILERADD